MIYIPIVAFALFVAYKIIKHTIGFYKAMEEEERLEVEKEREEFEHAKTLFR